MEGTRIYKNFHQWLLPPRAVVGILGLASVFVFVGIVLLAIGSSGLTVGGALFFGIGLILILICLLLCMHACFVLYVKDQGTQTQANANITSSDNKRESDFIPTYAVIDKKPPPSPSSVRNGRIGGGAGAPKKFVTLSGDTPQSATVSYQERGNTVQYQPHMTYSPTQEGSNFKYSSYNAGQSPYEYQQQQHYQQQHRIAQQQYAFPINSAQPTPYSTLSSKQIQNPSAIQVYPGFRPRYDEDYDNPGESTPIMNHQQHSSQWTTNKSLADETPEPTPLVHPSAKRPMTFDQVSSSKMSIYDNVQFGLNKLDEEE